jgi:hypothetical protein
MQKLVVGQKLWLVPSIRTYGQPREVSVVSVGRKWATLDCWKNARVDMETLLIDGKAYSPPGRCYLSREQHEETVRLIGLWIDFRRTVSGLLARPDGVTEANIRLAADLLGIQLI